MQTDSGKLLLIYGKKNRKRAWKASHMYKMHHTQTVAKKTETLKLKFKFILYMYTSKQEKLSKKQTTVDNLWPTGFGLKTFIKAMY